MPTSNSIYWNAGDQVFSDGIDPEKVIDLGTIGYQQSNGDKNLAMWDEGAEDCGIAWTSSSGGVITLYGLYLNEERTEVEESLTCSIPSHGSICAGIKKLSKYEFRLLIGLELNWIFIVADLSTGAHSHGATKAFEYKYDYSVNVKTCSFYGYTRSQNSVLGILFETTSYGTLTGYGNGVVHLVACVGNLLTGSFGIENKIVDNNNGFSGGGGWLNSKPQKGTWFAYHNGNGGFYLLWWLHRAELTNYTPHATWRLKKLYQQYGSYLGFEFEEPYEGGDAEQSYAPYPYLLYLENHELPEPNPATPSISISASAGGAGHWTPLNSFFHGYIPNLSYFIPEDSHTEYWSGDVLEDATPEMDYTKKPLTETGAYGLTASGFECGIDDKIYLVSYTALIAIHLYYTGYEVITACNRLNSGGGVLCWGRRNSDGFFGLMLFGQNGSFVDFIPVVASGGPTVHGGNAIIANGFLVVGTHGYWLGGTAPPQNTVLALFEFN